jgi:hypothetical protein
MLRRQGATETSCRALLPFQHHGIEQKVRAARCIVSYIIGSSPDGPMCTVHTNSPPFFPIYITAQLSHDVWLICCSKTTCKKGERRPGPLCTLQQSIKFFSYRFGLQSEKFLLLNKWVLGDLYLRRIVRS